MSDVAGELDQLRIAIGEVEALAAVTVESYDRQDWSGADPLHVERVAYLLGLTSRSATAAVGAFHRLHGAVADAQPAPAGERWDYERGTASGDGMSASDAEIVRRLREQLAQAFGEPTSHPFFCEDYLPGEDPDAALLRMLKPNKQVLSRSNEGVIAAMAHRK